MEELKEGESLEAEMKDAGELMIGKTMELLWMKDIGSEVHWMKEIGSEKQKSL